jgi:hypothetical protein
MQWSRAFGWIRPRSPCLREENGVLAGPALRPIEYQLTTLSNWATATRPHFLGTDRKSTGSYRPPGIVSGPGVLEIE